MHTQIKRKRLHAHLPVQHQGPLCRLITNNIKMWMLSNQLSERWNIQGIGANGWAMLSSPSIVKQKFSIIKHEYHHGNLRQKLVMNDLP